MNVVVYDPGHISPNLLPITYTRPVGDIRVGISTMAERWQAFLPGDYSWGSADYLCELFPAPDHIDNDTLFVAGNIVATASIAHAVKMLEPGQRLVAGDIEIAYRGERPSMDVTY
ncbi:MAG: putative sugar nucleotidyl transferase, partial [Muribaculaceae bacterium]